MATPRSDELNVAEGPTGPVVDWRKLPRNRKTKFALLGIGKEIVDKGDPRYARALLNANKYRKVRARELAVMHGFVSSGASALLASAALAIAASRFLYEKVAESGDIGLLGQASRLADSARQHELAAWEMSAREGQVKRRLDANNVSLPWMTGSAQTGGFGGSDIGRVNAKAGRKTNVERQLVASEGIYNPGTVSIDDMLSSAEIVGDGKADRTGTGTHGHGEGPGSGHLGDD